MSPETTLHNTLKCLAVNGDTYVVTATPVLTIERCLQVMGDGIRPIRWVIMDTGNADREREYPVSQPQVNKYRLVLKSVISKPRQRGHWRQLLLVNHSLEHQCERDRAWRLHLCASHHAKNTRNSHAYGIAGTRHTSTSNPLCTKLILSLHPRVDLIFTWWLLTRQYFHSFAISHIALFKIIKISQIWTSKN